jgi:general secretion pathway protein G
VEKSGAAGKDFPVGEAWHGKRILASERCKRKQTGTNFVGCPNPDLFQLPYFCTLLRLDLLILPATFPSHGVFMPCKGCRSTRFARNSFMKTTRPICFRHRSGFTLLEMVIVLGIIAMILGGAVFGMRKIGDAAKLKQVDADMKAYDSALRMYKLNATNYPTTQQGLQALVTKPTSAPVPRKWTSVADRLTPDPWGSEYGYKFPGRKNPSEFEIISKGPDGQEGTEDDISSQDD